MYLWFVFQKYLCEAALVNMIADENKKKSCQLVCICNSLFKCSLSMHPTWHHLLFYMYSNNTTAIYAQTIHGLYMGNRTVWMFLFSCGSIWCLDLPFSLLWVDFPYLLSYTTIQFIHPIWKCGRNSKSCLYYETTTTQVS